MKIVAANFADTLRLPGSSDGAETAVLDTVRHELRDFYGNGDDDLPAELTALALRLDRPVAGERPPA